MGLFKRRHVFSEKRRGIYPFFWAGNRQIFRAFFNFGSKIAKNGDFWDFLGNCAGRPRTFGQKSEIFAQPRAKFPFSKKSKILKISDFFEKGNLARGLGDFRIKNSKNREKIFLRKFFGFLLKNRLWRLLDPKLPTLGTRGAKGRGFWLVRAENRLSAIFDGPWGRQGSSFGPKSASAEALFGAPLLALKGT